MIVEVAGTTHALWSIQCFAFFFRGIDARRKDRNEFVAYRLAFDVSEPGKRSSQLVFHFNNQQSSLDNHQSVFIFTGRQIRLVKTSGVEPWIDAKPRNDVVELSELESGAAHGG
jgi:hypothetical protein